MKKHFVIIATGIILTSLNSCRENESLTEDTTMPALERSPFKKEGDSSRLEEFVKTDPPKDRDNWRMSSQP